MRRKKYLRDFLECLAAAALFLFIMVRNLSTVQDSHMEQYFIQNFMGIVVYGTDISQVLLQIVPEIVVFYIFSGVFLADYEINFVYVFTRVGSKQRWLLKKAVELLMKVVVLWLLIFVLSFLFGTVGGFTLSSESMSIYGRLFLFQTVSMFFMLFVQNFASLSIGRSKSFLLLLIFYAASLALGVLFYNKSSQINLILSLLPPSSQMYIWHSDSPLANLWDKPLKGFTTAFSMIWMAVLFVVSYVLSAVILQKKDLIELVKGESA
ncbi:MULTISPECIES: DUF2705 family protein [Caproicibacterium]|jgi:hypothetical protein|uniref:ABC transporter permease n=1 Tax=Caproicibacterium lactatifermentans TaxID=2666138 RepID=A0A859DV05_9FIRM|nr:DUF2705 family protein [Caproicibacterium lactatifermentans]ARP50133.1 hypothetical protein B6259_04110 [Ruminococcaceae bacterium CPB6]MDD4807570.1 DUF2705 family protein [Oscillospiraceae bacterium]QKN24143.1 hypothetical protein GJQ69_06405 [Caproicibacterium lactatifermentans]QKO30789.1 hypothetical protein GKP14_07125 [Caproicibacterium lactatifermentans]